GGGDSRDPNDPSSPVIDGIGTLAPQSQRKSGSFESGSTRVGQSSPGDEREAEVEPVRDDRSQAIAGGNVIVDERGVRLARGEDAD
ncbi:MAG: hypothetical protein KC431_16320, partial [Myxococcales bacterium]|nr:hypothetical protein [Myxococcales bacterium]